MLVVFNILADFQFNSLKFFKTLNALQCACSKFNDMDNWLWEEPDSADLIKFAMKQRSTVNQTYINDLQNFDINRFWDEFHHKREASDEEESEEEIEL